MLRTLATFFAGTACTIACAVQYSSELTQATGSDAGPTPVEAGPTQEVGADAGAGLASIPARPSDDDGTESLTFILATSSVAIDPSRDGGPSADERSLDLDRVATCPGQPSCALPPGGNPACDGPGGRDNALLSFLRQTGFDALDERNSAQYARGESGLIFVLEDYNGGRNDRQVTLSVFFRTYTQAALADGGPDPSGPMVLPVRDGSDYWRVLRSTVANPPADDTPCTISSCRAIARDTAAYVADGVLVGAFDLPIAVGLTAVVDLRAGHVVAKLAKEDGGVRLRDGLIVGRVRVADFLRGFPDPFGGTGKLCDNPGALSIIKRDLCAVRDLAEDFTKDGLGAPCNALSVAVNFEANPARLGTLSTVAAPTPRPCPDADLGCE